ncbi:hypothetical protein ACIQNG_04885 [Streptomyces sp. NPDC091377]|uniref:hypothetical protein n=1 Tax=Streptomyces sp. NPDC091377 TaxID=3365995 RepID=UPI0038235DD9
MPTCLAIQAATRTAAPALPQGHHRSTLFYDDVVRPTCEQLGLTFLRADALLDAGLPPEQLRRLLTEADVVVADLGAADAELSFVLGARHALGRCTVHVTEGPGTPHGAAGSPWIELPPRSADPTAARQRLTAVLTDLLGATGEQDDDAPGMVDLVLEAEEQLEAIHADMADLESATADLGAMMELLGEDMARVSHPGASARVTLGVVNRMGKAIDGPACDLEAAAQRVVERMDSASVALKSVLDWASNTPRGAWPDGVEKVLNDVVREPLGVSAAAGEFQAALSAMEMFGASSRHLRGPARRISGSIRAVFKGVAVFEEWQTTAARLLRT